LTTPAEPDGAAISYTAKWVKSAYAGCAVWSADQDQDVKWFQGNHEKLDLTTKVSHENVGRRSVAWASSLPGDNSSMRP